MTTFGDEAQVIARLGQTGSEVFIAESVDADSVWRLPFDANEIELLNDLAALGVDHEWVPSALNVVSEIRGAAAEFLF